MGLEDALKRVSSPIIEFLFKLNAPRFNAAYNTPSKLNQIAQPQHAQVNIPDVMINKSGNYEIRFGQGRKFYNGTMQIHHQNKWKTPNLLSINKISGSDIFGQSEKNVMQWELEDNPICSSIITYPNQPIVKFQVEFPKGLKDVTTNDFKNPIFKFPCFKLKGPNKRVFAFRDEEFSPPTRGIYKKGTQGPVVFYDNELNAAVLGPMENFMTAYTKQDDTIFHGLEGKIQEIPEGYKHSVLLFFTKGINKAVVDWCALLKKYHKTQPKDPYNDPIVANLGFWTDNGSYYYYQKEKNMSYEDTIDYACKTFKKLDIPFKYFQLDSWWYIKEKNDIGNWLSQLAAGFSQNGALLWQELPQEFPNGLKNLHEKIGMPFACHSRWFSPKSPYVKKYKSVKGKNAALPIEQRFWEELMKKAAKKGIITYEQDWIQRIFKNIPFLQEDAHAMEKFLGWMAEAARKNNILIQYCMAPPGAFLETLKLPAVTNARVANDYNEKATKQIYYPQFSQTNILAWAVGIHPSLDSYLTREKYSEQVTLLSNLGCGLICPGDKAERVNKDLLMKTCNEDGLILKPDRPITANDLMFKIQQKPYIMDTCTQKGQNTWRYIMAVNLWPQRVKDNKMTLRELGYEEPGVLYNFRTGELKETSLDDLIDIKLDEMDYKYFVVAPFLKEGVALIGAVDKYVTCANKLIPKVQTEQSVKFEVEYSPNSSLKVLMYSRKNPSEVKGAEWSYNPQSKALIMEIDMGKIEKKEVCVSWK